MTLFGSRAVPCRLLATAFLLAAPAAVSAQGSTVYTHSGCMNARNGAGIAVPCPDGSAVYYNPAALARQNGAVSFGATVIDGSGSFIHDTTAREIERAPRSMIAPHGWATWRPSQRIGVGLGVWAPYGLAIDWPVCPRDQPRCGVGFEGRFVGYDQTLEGLYFQPTIAYDLLPGRLSLGVGVDIVKADFEINRRLDLAKQGIEVVPGVSRPMSMFGIAQDTDFADATLSADAWGFTGHVAVLLNVTRAITIGARYLHSVELAFDGRADFEQLPTFLSVGPLPPLFPEAGTSLDEFLAPRLFAEDSLLADQDFSTTLTLPAQAVVGVAIQLDPTLRVMFDYQWTGWSVWDSARIEFRPSSSAPDTLATENLILDYQDAATYRLGTDYALTDRVTLRAGFSFARAAASDASVSPFLPDSDRAFFSGGVAFRASERLSLDFFAMGVNAADRRGRVVERDNSGQTAEQLNEGLYRSAGQLFGGTVTYHFGGPR